MNRHRPARKFGVRALRGTAAAVLGLAVILIVPLVSMVSASADMASTNVSDASIAATSAGGSSLPFLLWVLLGAGAIAGGLVTAGRRGPQTPQPELGQVATMSSVSSAG